MRCYIGALIAWEDACQALDASRPVPVTTLTATACPAAEALPVPEPTHREPEEDHLWLQQLAATTGSCRFAWRRASPPGTGTGARIRGNLPPCSSKHAAGARACRLNEARALGSHRSVPSACKPSAVSALMLQSAPYLAHCLAFLSVPCRPAARSARFWP